jgi:protein lifeguard
MLYSLSWAALAIGLVNWIFLKSSLVVMGMAFLFTIIYSIYLVIDTQLILGGKNKELTLDDYVLGSVIIYTDIISLFLKILQIIGKKKDD